MVGGFFTGRKIQQVRQGRPRARSWRSKPSFQIKGSGNGFAQVKSVCTVHIDRQLVGQGDTPTLPVLELGKHACLLLLFNYHLL
jgi:hypothetical protein